MKPQSNLNDCDVPFNNARLQFARKYRRHTIRSLARISGIAVRTISSYENGSGAPPSSPTLNALATALELPVSFFFAEDQEDFSKEQVSFRAPSKMTALDRDQHLCLASLIYELTQKIGVLFKLPVVNLPIFESLLYPESTNSIPDAVIESQADALRLKWGLGIEPISNLLNAVELNGIMIYSLPPSISSADGFSFWRGGRPFIIYNPNKTSERSRFDIAHELGHLVLHGNDSKISDSKTREREANTFASAFLMPKSGILSKLPHQCTISNLIPYKRKWKVSLAAFNVRLHHLKHISEWSYWNNCVEISKMNRKSEPMGLPPEYPQIVFNAIQSLKKEGKTITDIALMLNIKSSDFDDLVFGLLYKNQRTPLRIVK